VKGGFEWEKTYLILSSFTEYLQHTA
jgi:hypothetical protein